MVVGFAGVGQLKKGSFQKGSALVEVSQLLQIL
jgi:hypothetical protein